MKCPHCTTGINVEWDETDAYVENFDNPKFGVAIAHGECPECDGLIVKLRRGPAEKQDYVYRLTKIDEEEIIYPQHYLRPVESEVPESYRKDFNEACAVLNVSPKSSAALSRRLLQNILRQQYKIQHKSLAQEIDEFIKSKDVPSHLSGAIDAIRNVGNFAAHPLKDTNTREIVEVEPGEAEWLLDVLEALFDFTFVQPIRLKEKKDKLNKKLQAMGKPRMKE